MTNATRDMPEIIPFEPHPWLRGGHRQTLAGVYWPSPWLPQAAEQRIVTLADGDQVVLHDNRPPTWKTADPVVILLHGLCGCHQSPYMRRAAAKLNHDGFRTFRMDQRGWGSGSQLAQQAMHAGRSEDLQQACAFVQQFCPGSPLVMVGYSLGANVLLKLLAEYGSHSPGSVRGAIAVSPPMDLAACADNLQRGWTRWYERYFLQQLLRFVSHKANADPHWNDCLRQAPTIRTLRDFDHYFTARLSGFASAEDYYQQCSTLHRLQQITVPTQIIVAQDDPLVPPLPARDVLRQIPPNVALHQTPSGGHLGFVARKEGGYDGRWMDWVVQACSHHWLAQT